MTILSVGTARPLASRALGLVPGSKSSIGTSSLFGDTGGQAVTTPTFNLSEGGLTRTGSEFLNESRRNLADLRANRARFGEGFTAFRTARLQDVENARARTTGNLRSQLGRRGILGASFAQDAITRTELDFQNQADKVAAEIDVQEFEFNLQNLAQESQIAQANLTRELTELGLTTQFISGINSAVVAREQIRASIQIAQIQAAAQRRTGGGGVTFGSSFSRTGPGGPLGSFQFGSPTNLAGPATFGGGTSPFTIGSSGGVTQGASIPSTGPFVTGGFEPAG